MLPQGAPTSPTVTNMVCQKLDRRLIGLAKSFGLRYTRYADDLTFSGGHNVFEASGEFRNKLDLIIRAEGFRQNEKKVRLQRFTERQMVTGLVVNDRVNVVPSYIAQIKRLLWMWEKEGYAAAQEAYTALRVARSAKGEHVGTLKGKHVANVLAGKIDFLRMVDGGALGHFAGAGVANVEGGAVPFTEVSARHTKLNAWFNQLIERDGE